MKNLLKVCVVFLLVFTACKENSTEKKDTKTAEATTSFDSFGALIFDEGAIDSKAMLDRFKSLKVGDTINVKFASKIDEVCSKKGCWMKLDLTDGTQTMVRFKDYGFFMPLDAKDREVIVNGKAFVQETSVADLKHFAEDAGKTKEEIARITMPKVEFTFEADGVLMKK
ncbi:hypothetical protein KCTC32516_01287 [Polaribacter huanghezhanensis]|uniref:DUF4920 domain-containing protein n=1 Tax=Polaribacter huanghezhanensis TaxID=1354726 RepID=UPI0026495882|nr:DUF4920 domain-containing protein [Polaribacter huanghezhanensis]WKD85938.1 hypothetical protein KCTC32516_01287 [Polaribacter huanghezhanensis]